MALFVQISAFFFTFPQFNYQRRSSLFQKDTNTKLYLLYAVAHENTSYFQILMLQFSVIILEETGGFVFGDFKQIFFP